MGMSDKTPVALTPIGQVSGSFSMDAETVETKWKNFCVVLD
jgi:hypothetical protein